MPSLRATLSGLHKLRVIQCFMHNLGISYMQSTQGALSMSPVLIATLRTIAVALVTAISTILISELDDSNDQS